MSTVKNTKILRLSLLAMLTALIFVVTCLPIQTLGFEISLAMVPISIGAAIMGPSGGAILGSIYGTFSFLQCLGLIKPSALGMQLLAINPFYAAVTCLIPRILCGFLAGLVFVLLSKIDKTKLNIISRIAACLICPLLNTVFFMSSLMFLFGQTDLIKGYMEMLGVYNPFLFVIAFVGLNGLIEAIICFVLGTGISSTLAAAFRIRSKI